jgi:methanogenic corrinoid protein MtbC1
MSIFEFEARRRIASAIRASRGPVAEEATNQFLARHPDWQTRYGDRARQFGIEDAGYHQDFLSAAIESGQIEAFTEYGEWAARMLVARDIQPRFVAENFEQIGKSLRLRLPPADADIVDSFIQPAVERCLQGGADEGAAPSGQLEELSRMYMEAALGGSRQAALNLLLEGLHQGHSVVDLYVEVLQWAMYRIGQLWERNQITVAKEHTATAITQFVIAQIYPLIQLPKQSRGKVVITGVAGELHQIGGNMVADVLEATGWDVRFLGTNTPLNGVLDAVEEHNAGILGISATMLFNIPNVMRLIDAARKKVGNRIRIVVGGAAFHSTPMLYESIGANGCGFDLRSAIQVVNGLALTEH